MMHGMQESADVELWDPEDADECDDEAQLFTSELESDSDPAGQDGSVQTAGSAVTWDQVRPCQQCDATPGQWWMQSSSAVPTVQVTMTDGRQSHAECLMPCRAPREYGTSTGWTRCVTLMGRCVAKRSVTARTFWTAGWTLSIMQIVCWRGLPARTGQPV